MDKETFERKVAVLVRESAPDLHVRFTHIDGTHIARVSDGTQIIGNSTSRKISVRWGSGIHGGHTAMAVI